MSAVAGARRTRDAARTRAVILDAAEALFANRGFDGVSLTNVGAAAGVSRATPGYFFESKTGLYAAVLARLFDARTTALAPAFGAVAAWAASENDSDPIEPLLAGAVDAYLAFLYERQTFVALIEREALDGGRRLGATFHDSPVIADALHALRAVADRRGLRRFDPDQVLIALLAVSFFPLAHQATLLPNLGLDVNDPAFRRAHRTQVLDVVRRAVLAQP